MINFRKKSFTLLTSNFLWFMFILSLIPTVWCLFKNQMMFLSWQVISLTSIPLSFDLIVDLNGSLFSSAVLLISSSVVTFSVNYMAEDPNVKRFIMTVLLFILSMNFLVYIPNIMALLLGWDGLGLVSFILIIYYQNPSSLAAGMVTALANRIGDVMLIISIAWMVNQGHWNLFCMYQNSYSSFISMTIFIAAMTKSAQIPFSSWLPAAMAAPTPVSALVHSSTLVTAGVFVLIRFYPFLKQTLWFNQVCLGVATLTCLMAGICAMWEFDMKKIIALSTLSQLGVMMTSLGLGAVHVSYFHMVTHALFKALLFICAGNVIHQHGSSQDIRFMGNITSSMPSTSSCLNIANLALCGTPFMAGFYSKDLILEIFFMSNVSSLMLFLIVISTLMTLAYSIRFSLFIIWGEHKKCSLFSTTDGDSNVLLAEQGLSLGAIFSGALISWLYIPNPCFIILTLTQKCLIMSCFLLIILIIFINHKLNYYNSINMSLSFLFFYHNFSTMWFLSLMFSKLSSKSGLIYSKMMNKAADQGWNEMIGGQGSLNISKKLMSWVSESQKKPVNLFLLSSIMLMILMTLIII